MTSHCPERLRCGLCPVGNALRGVPEQARNATEGVPYRRGRGFTLIELLVVIGILGFLFGILILYYPGYSANMTITRAHETIAGMLLRAKQQAKRDGLATGIRLRFDPNPDYASEAQFIQQPDPLALGWVTAVGGTQATIHANLQPAGVDPLLAVGDYLEVNGGGRIYQVTGVDATTSPGWTTVAVDAPFPSADTYPDVPPSNYRIFAQPRLMAGEEPQRLPPGTQINRSKSLINTRAGYYEILFSPAGNIVNQALDRGKNLVFIEASDPTSQGVGSVVVAVQLRTGRVGVFPAGLNPNTNVWDLFVRSDGSGM